MSKTSLSKSQWSTLIRDALKNLAQSATVERGSIERAAEALHLSRVAIEKMKSDGMGSVESWIKLVAFKAQLSETEVRRLLMNPSLLVKGVGNADPLDGLFAQVKREIPTQELAAWLRLLLAKKQVEEHVGVQIKVTTKASAKKVPAKRSTKSRLKAAERKPTFR